MKFYERSSFKRLNAEWRDRLERAGFDDLEDKFENLKSPDLRTQNYEGKDQVLEFFQLLDEFLVLAHRLIPNSHWKILKMYSDGKKQTEISEAVKMSDRWVRKIVSRYTAIILAKLD